ncbi:deleted in malignant brain tumors 1 protein-like [Strongylocentrotus purpuratus]|uniref:SRCR domain-containing protein n=1 Tax=Strongylocentrotus purpuratus TaxID=7668 RepID=A0A7M7P4Q5_STRPU|nr:deleted in malignant brain tumors 1 protein-like [Strongylocentrotus purpuratus]
MRQQGRVELYTETTGWGSLCGNSSDIRDGQVLCGMLDYPGLDSIQNMNYNENWLPITNVGLNCTGTENSIDHCIYNTSDSTTCDKVTRIDCEDAVRLEEGPCDSEGRVEVYQHGSWGPVCDDNFTIADATVVCRMFGLQLVELLDWDVPPSVVSSNSATLKNPWCTRKDRDIRYCIHEPNATCNKYAAVKCSDPLNVCLADCQDYDSFESLDCPQSQTTQEDTTRGITSTISTVSTTISSLGQTSQEDTTQGISSTLSPVSTTSSSLVTTLSPIKEEVNKIVNTNITMDNIEVISDELANVTEKSTKFDEELLESVTDKLRSIVGFASEQNLTEDVIVQVSESVIGAVDNILNIPESTFETASSQQVSNEILTIISTLTEVIQKTSTNNFTYRYEDNGAVGLIDRKRWIPFLACLSIE